MLLKDFKPLDKSVLLCTVYKIKGAILHSDSAQRKTNNNGLTLVGSYVVSHGGAVNNDGRDIITEGQLVMLNDKAYSAQFVQFDDNFESTVNVGKANPKPDFSKLYTVKEYILINREEIVATCGKYVEEVKSNIILN